LVTAIKTILLSAIKKGGTTLKDFSNGHGKPGYFSQALQVYGRAGLPCLRCKSALQFQNIGQRSTVYCSNCQK
ncbi:MAG: zinc finger domain-containing protein, partial [Rickettsiella sp.]|nr:zinc finger domain-containing protein [Rickettsiella sp.]